MKILFISSWFPNKIEPTNGNFVQRHAEAVALQHDVEILHCIGDHNQKEKFTIDDRVINNIRTVIVYYRNSGNPLQNFVRRMQGYKLGFGKLSKPDLVHANVMHNNILFAIYLKKRHHIPFVITEHWTAFQENSTDAHGPVWRFFAKHIANQSLAMMPVSNNLKRGLQQLGVKVPLHIVSNVVNTEVFKLNDTQPKSDPFTFVHISSLVDRKNPKKIIETAAKLHATYPNFRLIIGGDGDLEPLNDLIQNLKAERYISTFGKLTIEEVAEKMQQSHCFILFSENETQGCVIVEANACGIPVISSSVGGTPEFVSPTSGILVQNNNTQELYLAMETILLNQKTFDTPEELHQNIAQKYNPESIAHQFTAVYNSVLKL